MQLVKMSHTRLGWAMNLITVVQVRQSCEKTEGHVTTELEIKVMVLQAKEY